MKFLSKYYDIALEMLKRADSPLNHKEIWQHFQASELFNPQENYGQTPWDSISAALYTDYKKDDTPFVKFDNPVRWSLKSHDASSASFPTEEPSRLSSLEHHTKFVERGLHTLLTAFVKHNPDFLCDTKTIYHESSSTASKGSNKWLHPDLVGFYAPFYNHDDDVSTLMHNFNSYTQRLFSFEMKISVTTQNLKEYFFQAVSNSSWANFGYLVALDYAPDCYSEMLRLNRAFGIGFIKLKAADVLHSEVIYRARESRELDLETIARLKSANPDFAAFIRNVNLMIKNMNFVTTAGFSFDHVCTETELREFVAAHHIANKT